MHFILAHRNVWLLLLANLYDGSATVHVQLEEVNCSLDCQSHESRNHLVSLLFTTYRAVITVRTSK